MKTVAIVIGVSLIAANICVLGIAASAAATDDVRSEIEAANAAFMQAFEDKDAAAIADLYTEDGQLLPPGETIIEGRDAIETFWQTGIDAGAAGFVLTTVEARGFDNEAYEVGNFRLVGDGGATLGAGKYIVIWKRVDGEWKLHRDIWNSNGA